jgi:hypothetical protein
MKYTIDSDCGSIESDQIIITVEITDVENIRTDAEGTYKIIRDDKIFIIRGGKAYSILGRTINNWMPF